MARNDSLRASIEVDRIQLLDGLRLLRRHVRPKKASIAVLSRDGEDLVIQLGGGEVRAALSGRWEGEARVKGRMILEAGKSSVDRDVVTVRVESGRLVFDGLSLPCDWETNSAPRVLIPVGASLIDILKADVEHSDEDLERNGVFDAVRDARKKRKRLIRAAVKVLQPLRVSEEEIASMVDRHVGDGA